MKNLTNKKIYEEMYNQYDGCCALCGKYGVEMHHIRYGACGRKTYEGNIIPLCKKHHLEAHSNKKKWKPILIEIIERNK